MLKLGNWSHLFYALVGRSMNLVLSSPSQLSSMGACRKNIFTLGSLQILYIFYIQALTDSIQSEECNLQILFIAFIL